MSRGHTHGRVEWWWRRGSVWSAGRTRVILGAAPAETDARVADGVALHLVDSHLGSVALDELDKSASLARRDLDVGDFTKALEEGAQFVLGNIAGQTTDENGGVVWVGELVHGLGRGAVVAHLGATGSRRTTSTAHGGRIHASRRASGDAHVSRATRAGGTLVLWGSGRDAHGTVTAVDALHFRERALLVGLVGEADEAVAAGEAGDGIGHDLGRLARWEARLEERHEHVLVDLGTQVADEDGELGPAFLAAVDGYSF